MDAFSSMDPGAFLCLAPPPKDSFALHLPHPRHLLHPGAAANLYSVDPSEMVGL